MPDKRARKATAGKKAEAERLAQEKAAAQQAAAQKALADKVAAEKAAADRALEEIKVKAAAEKRDLESPSKAAAEQALAEEGLVAIVSARGAAAEKNAKERQAVAESTLAEKIAAEEAAAQQAAEEKAAAQRAVEEKAAAQKRAEAEIVAGAKAAAERAEAEKTLADKVAAEKAAAEQAAAEKIAEAERAAQENVQKKAVGKAVEIAERAVAERVSAEKRVAAEKAAVEKAAEVADRAGAERAAAEKRAEVQKLAQEKAAAELAVAERVLAVKVENEKAAAENAVEEKAAAERAAAEKNGEIKRPTVILDMSGLKENTEPWLAPAPREKSDPNLVLRRQLSTACVTFADAFNKGKHYATGTFKQVYRGIHSEDSLHWEECVFKRLRKGTVHRADHIEKELNAAVEAARIIESFSRHSDCKIRVNVPEVVNAEDRQWLLEPFVGNWEKFNSNTGWVRDSDQVGKIMQALSHYSFHVSGGTLLLCDLQGCICSDVVILSNPVIMSLHSGQYGGGDLGPKGISTFFGRHKRNEFCQKHWAEPSDQTIYFEKKEGSSLLGNEGIPDDSNSDDWAEQFQYSGSPKSRRAKLASPVASADGDICSLM